MKALGCTDWEPYNPQRLCAHGSFTTARNRVMRQLLLICLLLASLPCYAVAQPVEQAESNWHQWRGPNGNGLASQGNPPTEWSPEKNIKWKQAIPGRGNASPIVWGDKIFIATAVDTGKPDPNAPAA